MFSQYPSNDRWYSWLPIFPDGQVLYKTASIVIGPLHSLRWTWNTTYYICHDYRFLCFPGMRLWGLKKTAVCWMYNPGIKSNILPIKGLFTWRWGTPGRWGNPLSWDNPWVTRLSISLILIWSRLHDRWGDPPNVISPIWSPPPPCKQARRRRTAV